MSTSPPLRSVMPRAISTASATADPPSYRLALATSSPVSWHIIVWYS